VTREEIRELLRTSRVIAVVGASDKPDRPSYDIASTLLDRGYTIIPVNPGKKEILGQKCYPDLKSIPVPVDIVNIFRNPADVPPVVDEAIAIKAKCVWMQTGISHPEAAKKAADAGLKVLQDSCIKVALITVGLG
jgi:hypothetical protein